MRPGPLLAFVLGLPCAFGRGDDSTRASALTADAEKHHFLRGCVNVIGKEIANREGQTLGRVEDLIFHPKGSLAFVVMSASDQLAIGDQCVPVPWRALRMRESDGAIVFDVQADRLRHAHSYSRNSPVALAKVEWWNAVEGDFDAQQMQNASPVEASTSLVAEKALLQFSDIKGRRVETPSGQRLGEIEELVIDPRASRVDFAVLVVGESRTTGKRIAVPWSAIHVAPDHLNPRLEHITLAMSTEQLARAPDLGATRDDWDRLSDRTYVSSLDEFYSLPPRRNPETIAK